MLGIYAELLYYWPAEISHNHSDPEKEVRYRTGTSRLALLKRFAEPFACYFDQASGDYQAAYLLVHEDESDLHPDMPETTRVEYVCGKKTPEGDYMIFSYQWFDTVERAVSYAESHGMNRDLDEYEDAQLLKQKISASFVGIVEDIGVESAEDVSKEQQEEAFERLMSDWKPGTILQGIGGKHINFNQTPKVDSFKDTSPEFKRSIAAGIGVPYMALSSDYGSANYTSSRMEFLDFYKLVDHLQENVIIPQLGHKWFNWFMLFTELIGLRPEGVRGIWTPPRRELIEPLRDIQAIIQMIQSGLISHAEGIRILGFDPFDMIDEIATVQSYMKKKNVKVNYEKKPQMSVEKEGKDAS